MKIRLEEDPDTGEIYLPISDDLAEELGWEIGDQLFVTPFDDGSMVLTI